MLRERKTNLSTSHVSNDEPSNVRSKETKGLSKKVLIDPEINGFLKWALGIVLTTVLFFCLADVSSGDTKGPLKRVGHVHGSQHKTPDSISTQTLGEDGRLYHLVFSTDCTEYQHWQSYLLFHSALKVKQPGFVTRIASGCSDSESEDIRKWHHENIQSVMSDRFQLHLTPHFSAVKDADGNSSGQDYKYFNKPFGLRHWMEHGEGMGFDINTGKMMNEDMVVILTDPDMLLLRPITGDFSNKRETIVTGSKKEQHFLTVQHGQPFAQKYGFGSQWKTKINDVDEITGPGSPVNSVSYFDALNRYSVGPPYLATARDMHSISVKWSEFVPGVHKQYPYLLAEMFAFCLAAAHLELPHQVVDSLMVSNPIAGGGEGWQLIHKIDKKDICSVAQSPDHEKYAVPSVIHFCQRYNVGPWFFAKRRIPKDIFSCDSPLLREPELDIAVKYDYKITPEGAKVQSQSSVVSASSFAICVLIQAVNDAAHYYKQTKCDGGGNQDKTIVFVKTDLFDDEWNKNVRK
eukprot:CAMPEP_0197833378 /NCGR_PEP_ID=MMETSP1437-20131217/18849_1 /TAXON_ID=49252 ORGANISM="Eucampia antarctica, Strain CCMP1452" /NCGR_SAMPLE_ID=MMETSP1437 /ASSEMBLY_ACC=CAM_ASM_001096 /LENGTH=517 /DNA_ID=CAMNT_0043437397 /DNA_START=50 /DNA_END=1606 /DNA_ORIENTATION=+